MSTNIELYEVLKDRVGTEAARMLAVAVPRAEELATKDDLRALQNRLMRFMLGLFVPLWIGMYATLGTLIVALLVRK